MTNYCSALSNWKRTLTKLDFTNETILEKRMQLTIYRSITASSKVNKYHKISVTNYCGALKVEKTKKLDLINKSILEKSD